jgi:alpha-glucosidase
MVWQANAPMGGFTTAPRAWLPVPADHMLKAPDVQEKQNDSLLHHYRATLGFRKQHPALVKGSIETLDAPDGVLMFTREGSGETLLCAYNMTESAVSVPLPADLTLRGLGAPGSIDVPVDNQLNLPAFGSFVGAVI